MLLSIRRGATTMAFKILIALFIVALVILFSLGDYIGAFNYQDQDPVVYKVKNTAITESQLTNSIVRTAYPLRNAFPGGLDTKEKIKSAGLHELAASQVLNPEVTRQEFKRLGLHTSQSDVAKHIAANEEFRGSDGRFSDSLYAGQLSMLGMDNNTYRRGIATQLNAASVQSALRFTPELLPAKISAPLLTESLEERKFELVTVKRDQIEEPAVNDEDLQAYMSENKDDFQLGETRAVSALFIDPKDLEAKIEISEETLEKTYEERKASYARLEQRTMSQVLFDSEDEANAAIEKAGTDASLEDIAKAAEKQVIALPANQSKQDTAHGKVGFTLEKDTPSAPFETAFGWHVVEVSNILPAYNPTLVQLRSVLTNELKSETAADSAEELSIEVDKLVGEGASLEEIADELDLEVKTFEPITNRGLTASRSAVSGMPRDNKLFSEIFNTPDTETSFLSQTTSGTYFVVRIDKVNPERPQTFEEAKSRLNGLVKRKKWTDALTEKADSLIASGKDLAAIAEELGGEVVTTEFVSRSTLGQQQNDVRYLSGDAFEQPQQDKLVALPAGANVVIAKLLEVKTEELSETEGGQELVNGLAQQYQNELAQQYQSALRAKANVDISEAALDRAVETAARQLR